MQVVYISSDVVVTIDQPHQAGDSTWDFVARAGFTNLAHAVITPVEIREDGSMDVLGNNAFAAE
jgi:hypothetical protein